MEVEGLRKEYRRLRGRTVTAVDEVLLGNPIVSGKDEGGEVVGRTVLQAGLYLTVVTLVTMILIAAATACSGVATSPD